MTERLRRQDINLVPHQQILDKFIPRRELIRDFCQGEIGYDEFRRRHQELPYFTEEDGIFFADQESLSRFLSDSLGLGSETVADLISQEAHSEKAERRNFTARIILIFSYDRKENGEGEEKKGWLNLITLLSLPEKLPEEMNEDEFRRVLVEIILEPEIPSLDDLESVPREAISPHLLGLLEENN